MHKFLILISIAVYCKADGLGGGVVLGGVASYGAIPAAIKSIRTVDVRPVHLPQDPIIPQVIEVAPLELPVKILFNSKSSPVLVQQIHVPGAPGQVEKTSSEEEPHRVVHEVVRPVIQELREVIQPYRRVVQEIQPVLEQVQTIVARGEPRLQAVAAPVGVVGTVGLGGGLVGVGNGLIGTGLGTGGVVGLGNGLIGTGLGTGGVVGLGGGIGNGILLNGGGIGLSGGKLLTGTLGGLGLGKGGLLLANSGYKSSSGKAASSA